MKKYTVLLLRPDYIADEFGKDTYLAHVVAIGPLQAIQAAQVEAVTQDDHSTDPGDDSWVDSADYHPLFCCYGHHEDLVPFADPAL